MNRSVRTLLVLIAATMVAPAPASATTPLRGGTVADDLGLPLRGWTVTGRPGLRQVRIEAPNHYAIDGRSLSLSPGGSIGRPLPPRPWSLSLDVRIARGGALRIDLGGQPVVLRQRGNGTLSADSGDQGATLPAGSAGPGGWHHVEVAGFDPAEVHVDGTRIPHGVVQAARIRLRALSGATQLTGLFASRRDDRRALLLHRLAAIHSGTAARRFPVRTGADGVLRFERGRDDGFYSGALWKAFGITGARLFRDWGERATFEQFGLNDHRKPPVHWQGLRWYESSAQADQRTCDPVPRQHRCRLLRKSTTSTPLYGLWVLNGTGTIPTVLWPGRCPSCTSADEVETRIETMLDVATMEWNYTLSEYSRRANPHLQVDPSPLRPAALEHAGAVAQLLVRPDGSTAESVRTNRLDGTVLSYEHSNALSTDSTWARGHASAIYGFARMGLRFERPELLAVAERAARFLDANLPASRIPLHDLAAPDGPADPEAGALYAAGLLRLAEACERLSGACSDGPRWEALGREMLGALVARLNTHLPIGYSPAEGDTLMGIDYTLEAIERAG